MWDNGSKHKSKMFLDYYYIENIIQLFEYLTHNPNLNPIENNWTNIMYKLGVNGYKNIKSLKLDIEEYWINSKTHLSSVIDDSMRKEYIWILNREKWADTKYIV